MYTHSPVLSRIVYFNQNTMKTLLTELQTLLTSLEVDKL